MLHKILQEEETINVLQFEDYSTKQSTSGNITVTLFKMTDRWILGIMEPKNHLMLSIHRASIFGARYLLLFIIYNKNGLW